MNDVIRLGFTRGVAPSKWERRWRAAMPATRLEIVPIETPYGRPTGRLAEESALDVMIERVAPGARPLASDPDADPEHEVRTHHAFRLYEESVALVLPIDHELAEETEISLSDLALVRILDYPDHAPEWPAAEPWEDPSWMPGSIRAALELVSTGLGGIMAPLPLARHLINKREHAILRVVAPEGALPGTTVWASWPLERDAADVQQLAGILRGRTARSSRRTTEDAPKKSAVKRPQQQQPAKKKPALKPNSRGAQLAAAREKAERAKAAKRAAKKKR